MIYINETVSVMATFATIASIVIGIWLVYKYCTDSDVKSKIWFWTVTVIDLLVGALGIAFGGGAFLLFLVACFVVVLFLIWLFS